MTPSVAAPDDTNLSDATATRREHAFKALRHGTRSHDISVLPTQYTPRVHPLIELTIPVFSFTAEAGPHLPTSEAF